ncbi:MAG: hypothetical protein AAGI72_05460 [Pseudomonadota bacterium]
MIVAVSVVAQSDNRNVVRLTYSGVEMPDSRAFQMLLTSVAVASREPIEPLEIPLMVYVTEQNMRYNREQAEAFVEELTELYAAMNKETEAAVVDSVCVPEATEWWPDTQALSALDRIGVIRETVYQKYYDDLLASLDRDDQALLEDWVNDNRGTHSRILYAESYADRPEVAQDILVQFCDSQTDR